MGLPLTASKPPSSCRSSSDKRSKVSLRSKEIFSGHIFECPVNRDWRIVKYCAFEVKDTGNVFPSLVFQDRLFSILFTSALEGGATLWSAPRPGRFTPGKDPVPIVEEARWGPRASLYVWEKSRPYRNSIPGPSSPYRVGIPTELPGPSRWKYS
jgi:hypothetical protein